MSSMLRAGRGGCSTSLLHGVSRTEWGARGRLTGVRECGTRDFGAAETHGFAMRLRVVTGAGGVSSARAREKQRRTESPPPALNVQLG